MIFLKIKSDRRRMVEEKESSRVTKEGVFFESIELKLNHERGMKLRESIDHDISPRFGIDAER